MVNCFMARSQTNFQFEGSENVHYPTKVDLTSEVKSRLGPKLSRTHTTLLEARPERRRRPPQFSAGRADARRSPQHAPGLCVYRKLKLGRSGGEVRQRWRVI